MRPFERLSRRVSKRQQSDESTVGSDVLAPSRSVLAPMIGRSFSYLRREDLWQSRCVTDLRRLFNSLSWRQK